MEEQRCNVENSGSYDHEIEDRFLLSPRTNRFPGGLATAIGRIELEKGRKN